MASSREVWEAQLNDFDGTQRRDALGHLMEEAGAGRIELAEPKRMVNLHCHTFFSFNGYGYSPSCLAWKARCAGLMAAGVMDFDVLDAAEEFLEACRVVGLRGCAGIETRTYIAPFATREINSPGEPGIAYHIGVGFASRLAARPGILAELKDTAQARNRGILERVGPHLMPVALDYDRDVLTLSPNGNPTERHICTAYDLKAREHFRDEDERAGFWAAKLGGSPEAIKGMFKDPPMFQGFIRTKTMKAGGVGYVKPEGPDFPAFSRVNEFILDAGAIPVFGWLDGLTEGERAIDELLGVMLEGGVAAVNVIPDRNWNVKDPALKKTRVDKLHEIAAIAQARDLPLIVGTEMNAYGQPFVDNFDAPEMAPVVEPALEGAYIVYAHTLLTPHGMGYLSDWARRQFPTAKAKNVFFARLGRIVPPSKTGIVAGVNPNLTPGEVLALVDA